MSYLVLARKYRPQTFEQVVRQEHVTHTLANAISSGRVAHAILFSGPRGTGKTTVARILAKAMNCENGPTSTPCNICRSCTEITSGSAADVFEIDGASNNGVDQIRELKENAKYMPQHSRYKIYIIDEVHMLSVQAFNALLKTLEEPPPHVMFFFATTEPQKIPVTILSRCQRHDLRRVDIASITKHMKALCEKEHVDITDESLGLIARESGGSMRDALSLLDQVLACSDGAVVHERILDILGVVDRKVIFEISDAVLNSDVTTILDVIESVYDHGHNLKTFYPEIVSHFRDLLVVKMGKNTRRLVDVPDHEIEMMASQIKNISEGELGRILDILFREEVSVKLAAEPKLALEMAFIRMFQVKPILPIDMLIEKIDHLKKEIDNGMVNAPAPFPQKENFPTECRETQSELKSSEVAGTYNVSNGEQTPSVSEIKLPVFNPSDSTEQTWENIISVISSQNCSLRPILEKCKLCALTDHSIEIEVGDNGYTRNRLDRKSQDIKNILKDFFGRKMNLVIKAAENVLENDTRKKNDKISEHEVLGHPMVVAALDIFGGKVAEVKIL